MNAEAKLTLPPQTIETADAAARPVLEKAAAKIGFLPNMYKGMGVLPGLLETYMDGYARFRTDAGFAPAEQEVVFLTISVANGCDYCVAAHSTLADKVSKVPSAVLKALRDGTAIPDAKLAALAAFTTRMLETRGLPSKADLAAFLAAGYQERHVLGIILAISVKTISNYSNRLFHTEVDTAFAGHAWHGK